MKKIGRRWRCVRSALAKIHLVDKFLILFMIVLLAQSAYNLFANHIASPESNGIDVIIRTSTAGIFGYFLSTNFIRHASAGTSGDSIRKNNTLPPAETGSGIQNRIGFSDSAAPPDLTAGNIACSVLDEDSASRLQVIAAASIGLFCLVVLILLRNVAGLSAAMATSPSVTSTVTQFRDIVSGCIGFLIGCPTSSTPKAAS